ncbi:MAG: hypothetical protein WCP74_06320 [Sphingobacteriia bacterium]|jgi:hypothetical protein
MKKYLLFALIGLSIMACKEKKQEESFDKKTYEVVKETLEEKEKKNPTRFIVVSNRDRKNIIGQTVVIVNLTNKATIATYKDIALKLSFFSKTSVKLDEGNETVYETIKPGQTIKFKTKYFAPKGTDSVAVKVMDAKAD